jgi:hypothetical protein
MLRITSNLPLFSSDTKLKMIILQQKRCTATPTLFKNIGKIVHECEADVRVLLIDGKLFGIQIKSCLKSLLAGDPLKFIEYVKFILASCSLKIALQ